MEPVGVRQDSEAQLHALLAIGIVPLFLVAFHESADDKDSVYSHLVVLGAQVLLGLDRQLCQSDGQAAAHVVVVGVH